MCVGFVRLRILRHRNLLLFFFLAVLWGSNWSFMKTGVSLVNPVALVFHRFLISAIVLAPVFLLLRKRIPKDTDTLGKLVFLGLLNSFNVFIMHAGLVLESSGIGAVLTYTQPLFVFCLAILFLKEKVTAMKLSGVLLGFVGVVVLFSGRISSLTFSFISLMMIVGAVIWAVAIVFYKKFLNHIDPFVANFFQLFVGVLLLSFLSVVTNNFTFSNNPAYLWIILYVAVGGNVAGFSLWLFLLRQEEATSLSGSSFIIPVIALFFGWQILGESISLQSMIGSALILAGIYLVNLRSRQKSQN